MASPLVTGRAPSVLGRPACTTALALLDHPDALGWRSLSGQMGAPLAPPRAGGGAHVSTFHGASVWQRMTCPFPALPARDPCHRPCHQGTSIRRSGRPAGAGGGGGAYGGRVRVEAGVRERCQHGSAHGRQPGRRGGGTPAPGSPPLPPPPPQGRPQKSASAVAGPA